MLPAAAAAAADALPDVEELAQLISGGATPWPVRDLHAWLCALHLKAPLHDRCEQLAEGMRWLRAKRAVGVGPAAAPGEPRELTRLRLLLSALERVPAFGERVRALVAGILQETRALRWLEVGLPNQRGVGAEASDRLSRRFLPSPPDATDLAELAAELLPSLRDEKWLRAIDPTLEARLLGFFTGGVLLPAVDDAAALAATRVSSLGLTEDIRLRSSGAAIADSPFFRLPRAVDALGAGGPDAAVACRQLIDACRAEIAVVASHLEEFGVSIDVVYRLEVMGANLDRLELFLSVRAGEPAAARSLLATLVGARARDRSLRDLIRTNAHLLARKIVEHAGKSGEHYITRTGREWLGMLGSAGGGGVLTAGTTALKYAVVWLKLPLFIEGFLASCNYAGSFLLMQLCGFTLATKQPSMTAAALAGALKDVPHGDPQSSHITNDALEPLVTMIARICRSQVAAAIGNILFVIPAAVGLDFWWRWRTGHPFLDEETARHSLHSLDLFRSGTLPFAVLTGALLWLSSLGAGWLENWMAYHRLREAIAEHRAGRIFGRRPLRWLAQQLSHGVSGIGGNVTLGFLLGMVPVFGKFLGVPLEVRHVTLSTGSLTLSAISLGGEVLHERLWAAAAGIAVIGLCNFGVSFVLALGMALRARTVEHVGRRLFGMVLRRFFRSPLEFFVPTKSGADFHHRGHEGHENQN
jgi:site-specific recombinase